MQVMAVVDKKKERKKYTPILPGSSDWPVVQLSKNRKDFINEVISEAKKQIKLNKINYHALIEELELTLYLERLRIKQNRWKVDPEDEERFWENVKSKLVNISNLPPTEAGDLAGQIIHEIISRYTDEIAGNFRPSSYRMTRKMVTFFFARLLNASRVKGLSSLWSTEFTLQDKINITGEIDHIRNLAKIGTVVMVPTHFSNLDSVLIGWVIHTLGLPPFIYGAGLNLFNIELFAYFMNSLGAYKVDRRKKNLIYLETLKTYSSLAIKKGCHSLFFPGGTRSRSGKIEKRLKLGLLGTTLEAQRFHYENSQAGDANKIFIVPVVINYHFVLEAPALIHEYLQLKGQERYYVESDEFSTSYKILKFLIKFFTKGSDISVSIGRGMDIMGNYVDDEGRSTDKHGRLIHTRDYFKYYGQITKNKQRDDEYTRMLSESIVKEYHRINRVFSSHLAAFVGFEMLKKKYHKIDLYNLLRLPEEEQKIDYNEFRDTFNKVRNEIFRLNNNGEILFAPHLEGDLDEVISHGIANVGMYHSKRPLIKTRDGNIGTEDLNTLFFYHNRLDGYALEKFI
jgi:glycerol-3-phosphate O-acyltransferase